MDVAVIAILIAGATLLLNLGIHVYGGGWNLSSKLAAMEQSLRKSITDAKDEVEERQDAYARQVGETIQAMREKINSVELNSANTYMRRESFYTVKAEMAAEIKELGKELKERLVRMETKIDSKT